MRSHGQDENHKSIQLLLRDAGERGGLTAMLWKRCMPA